MTFLNPDEQAFVWEKHSRQWDKVGPPLKPSREDGELILSGLREVFNQQPGECKVAILGVTPELVRLPWPSAVVLNAYDHSEQMIASVWSPHPNVPSIATQARWQHLPVDDATYHAAAGDGSLNVLPGLNDYKEVLKELHRVMLPNSIAVIRCFLRPDIAESLEEVRDGVLSGRVGSFHAFKWRLAMSLVDGLGASVAVSDIHTAFEALFPSRALLAEITGWPEEQIDTIDAYRGLATRYSFPTLQEMRTHCAPYFAVRDINYSTYELAERCPTLTLVRQNIGESKT